MRSFAEDVQHVAHAVTHRVHQVVALLRNAGFVADVVKCIDHEVNRHNIDAAALQAHRRHPWRQQLAHALDQLEEIVGAVNLVHFASGAVTHHHGGTKHSPWHLAFLAYYFFALVLGPEIRMLVVFSLFKHVFAEHALIQTRSRNRRHMVKMPGINGFGKLDRVARAINVDSDLAFFVSTQVIDGRKVVEMAYLALELFDVFGADTEFFAGQVAMHSHRPGSTDAPVLAQGGYLASTFLADQEMHRRAFSLQEFFHQAFTNEACGSRDEIMHIRCPSVFGLTSNEALILA